MEKDILQEVFLGLGEITKKTREYFQRNSSLSLVNREGDLNLEGSITQYNLSPVAPVGSQGVERAAQTRLTIGVKVKFTNSKNQQQNEFAQNALLHTQ